MRDWTGYVRAHLSLPDLDPGREEKVIQELASQFEDVYHEHLSAGVSELEAEARAERHVPDWEQLKADILCSEDTEPSIDRWLEVGERAARRRRWIVLGDFWQDLHYALRAFRKSPAFFLVSLLTLAIGIGSGIAIFSVLEAVLLRPLPFPQPDRLVMVWHANLDNGNLFPLSGPDYYDWKEESTSFEDLGVFVIRRVNLSGDETPERAQTVLCTAGILRALAVEPSMGRFFSEEEERPGAGRVALLSDNLWKVRYGAAPDIVGSDILINGQSYSVIGVMPSDFEFPNPVWNETRQPELFLPLTVDRDNPGRNSNWLFSHGRLRDGLTVEDAEKELQAIAARLAETYPDTNTGTTARLLPLHEGLVRGVSRSLWILMGSVGLLLLIACANVASLLLARGSSRQAEVAIRASMGAGRGRLVRQLLTESMVLAAAGGSLGVILGVWGVAILHQTIPVDVPRIAGLHIDGSVLLFSVGVTLLTAVLFGLIPAFSRSRVDPVQALQEGGRGRTTGRRQSRFLGGLVVIQVTLSLVLANGAMLMLKSYLNVTGSPELVSPENVLVAGISLEGPAYQSRESKAAFWQRFLEKLENLPGVEHVGATTGLPLGSFSNAGVLVGDEVFDPTARGNWASVTWVTKDYFQAVGIPLLTGRPLRLEDETGDPIGVVVNRALADRFWPGESVLGKRLRGSSSPPWFDARIVGVVDDVRQWGLELPLQAEIFFPFNLFSREERWMVVRSSVSPLSLVPLIREELASIDPNVAMSAVRTGVDLYDDAAAGRRFRTWLFGLFAMAAFVLVASGVYGVLSYHVAERRHEIGVRLALGAETSRVLKWILRRGIRLCVLGIGFGIAGVWASARITESMLYHVSSTHPLSILAVAFFLIILALAASLIPALKAVSVDPVTVLRSE
jgi:putative ABC transport system permease protein